MKPQPQLTDDEKFWNSFDAKNHDTRIDVNADALLYRASGQSLTISIQNLSIHGVGATSGSPPLVGEAVEIELAGLGLFQGVVRWQHQNKFGVHTFERIDLNAFFAQEE